jgi:hypothetical protein
MMPMRSQLASSIDVLNDVLDGLGEQSCTHGVKFRQPGYRGRRRSWNHACRTKGSDQRERWGR